MNDQLYDEINIEHIIQNKFGIKLNIDEIIASKVPVSRSDDSVIFKTDKRQYYILINTKSKKTFGDIKKILSKMEIVPFEFLPPNGKKDYFIQLATEKFNKTFPGRKVVSEDDLHFYKTTVLYSPALIQIKQSKNGKIYCFDADARNSWRPCMKFTYIKIDTNF